MANKKELRFKIVNALNRDNEISDDADRLITHIFHYLSSNELEEFTSFVEEEEGIDTDEEE